MNLLLFTVELERSDPTEGGVRGRPRAAPERGAGTLRWIALTIAAVVCATAAAGAGWAVSGGGGPFEIDLPDWLPIGTASAATDPANIAHLQIESQPNNATVLVDGRERGKTPLSLNVVKGTHTLRLTNPVAIDDERKVTASGETRVSVSMLWRRPPAMLLKPAYPGANIRGATFLADGRLAMTMAVPSRDGRHLSEAWILNPATGRLEPVSSERAAIVVVSPDGTSVAFVQPPQSRSSGDLARLSEVRVAGAGGSRPALVFALPNVKANAASGADTSNDVEEVHDIVWSPDRRHLLVNVRLVGGYASASRSRLLLVDPKPSDGQQEAPVELLTLPTEVVAGSYIWAADGNWVAFLTEASSGSGSSPFLALCAVDIRGGGAASGFRYVADLGRVSDAVGPLAAAQAAWSPGGDGRLVFAAPTPKVAVSNPLGLPTTTGGDPGLFVGTPSGAGLTAEEGRRLGAATGLIAPAWSATDSTPGNELLALARSPQGSRPLLVRRVDPMSGDARNLDLVLPLGVGGSGPVAARWDLGHGRLLVMARHDSSNSGLLDYWLVQLRAPGGEES